MNLFVGTLRIYLILRPPCTETERLTLGNSLRREIIFFASARMEPFVSKPNGAGIDIEHAGWPLRLFGVS